MHLQSKLGMWQSILPFRTFCTSSQTGRLPLLCLWLFFCSRWKSVEKISTELSCNCISREGGRDAVGAFYFQPLWSSKAASQSFITPFMSYQKVAGSMIWNTKVSGLMLPYSELFNTVLKTLKMWHRIFAIRREKKFYLREKKQLRYHKQTRRKHKSMIDLPVWWTSQAGWKGCGVLNIVTVVTTASLAPLPLENIQRLVS